MTYLFRPIHPSFHKNADGSNFECLQTEDNSFWLLHSFKVEYPVYVLIQVDNDLYNELSEFRRSYVPEYYYNHHLSSWDVNNFLYALANGLDSNYQLNSWQQEVYRLWLQDKEDCEKQNKNVAEMLNYISFDFSEPESLQVY